MDHISHSRAEEELEAKALWFQPLPLEDRMDLLVEFTELVLQNQPRVWEQPNAEPPSGRIRIVSNPQR